MVLQRLRAAYGTASQPSTPAVYTVSGVQPVVSRLLTLNRTPWRLDQTAQEPSGQPQSQRQHRQAQHGRHWMAPFLRKQPLLCRQRPWGTLSARGRRRVQAGKHLQQRGVVVGASEPVSMLQPPTFMSQEAPLLLT